MVFVTRLIQPVQSTHIYGVEWDWTSSGPTKGTRTDDAAGFEDPNPAVNNGTGSSPFDSLLSFADATALWGLSESTLRKAVAYRKLAEGLDAQKFGKQWVVTRSAMEREYGPQPQ